MFAVSRTVMVLHLRAIDAWDSIGINREIGEITGIVPEENGIVFRYFE